MSKELELTHLDAKGQARMVDVSEKDNTTREARAMAVIKMLPETLQMILEGKHKKGDVMATARIAGIMAAKSHAGFDSDVPSVDADLGKGGTDSRRREELRGNLRHVQVGRSDRGGNGSPDRGFDGGFNVIRHV